MQLNVQLQEVSRHCVPTAHNEVIGQPNKDRAGEEALRIRALTALPGEPDSILST